jgi:conjugal transfer pilin signal peptidase TrbI
MNMSITQKPTAIKKRQSLWVSMVDLARHLISHWPVTILVCGLYAVAWHFLFVNISSSLPYTLVWVERDRLPQRGELIVYRCCPNSSGIAPPNMRFFKKVAGVAGDSIRVKDRTVIVNQTVIGIAKERAATGQVLTPIVPATRSEPMPIPAGFYFAQGLTADSFDSRYQQSGLVAQSAILGVAHPIF